MASRPSLEDALVEVDRAAAAGADEHREAAQQVGHVGAARSEAGAVEDDDAARRGALGRARPRPRRRRPSRTAPAATRGPSASAQPVGERVDGQAGSCSQIGLIVSSSSTLQRRAGGQVGGQTAPSTVRRGLPGWITQSSVAGITPQSGPTGA